MAIGVSGASGHLGTGVLRHLSGRVPASDIVGITRHPEKLDSFAKQGADIRAGDFNEPAGLQSAFDGIERLLIIPTADLEPNVRPRQHLAAIKAAGAAGVRHITYVSTVGARPSGADGILETHFTTEQALIDSGTAWTILRMGPYTEVLLDAANAAVASGTYIATPGAPAAYVTRDDVGAAAAGILATNGHEGVTYHATGPESITPAEIAKTLSSIGGVAVAFVPQSESAHVAGLVSTGLPAAVITVLARFHAALRNGAFDLVTGDVERLAGRRAEAPSDFLARHLQRSRVALPA